MWKGGKRVEGEVEVNEDSNGMAVRLRRRRRRRGEMGSVMFIM